MNQQDQSVIAAFWVLDGIDCCCIGYLPKAYVKNWKQYDGALVQVVEVYSGDSDSPTKHQKLHRNYGLAVAVYHLFCRTMLSSHKEAKNKHSYIKIA